MNLSKNIEKIANICCVKTKLAKFVAVKASGQFFCFLVKKINCIFLNVSLEWKYAILHNVWNTLPTMLFQYGNILQNYLLIFILTIVK